MRPSEKDSVAFLEWLEREAAPTMRVNGGGIDERTPFDVVGSGVQNAFDTVGHADHYRHDPVWCECVLDSIRSLLCDAESDANCAWFKARGLRY